jgi:DNA-binding response OmpR family regulator
MNARSTRSDEGYRGNLNGASFLQGKAILLVEDEFLLALQLEELVQSRGGIVRGPYRRLDDAMQAAEREDFDFAILDINLSGTMVYPLADHLLARGIPFLFLTGYSLSNLPERFRPMTRLSKPCDPDLLISTLRSQL